MVVYLEVWYAGFRSAKLSKLELESLYLLLLFYPFFVCLFQDSGAQLSSQGAYPPNAVQDDELAAEVCLRVLNADLPFS